MYTSFNPVCTLSQPYLYSSTKSNTFINNDLLKSSDVTSVLDTQNKTQSNLIQLEYALCGEDGNPEKPYCRFYKTADYSEDDPVYIAKLYSWDNSEPITREIHINEIDFSHMDKYEAFSYGIYLEEHSKCDYISDMLIAFEHANDNTSNKGCNFNKVNVLDSIKVFMNEGLKNGYYDQYIHYLTIFNTLKKHAGSF